MNFHAPDFYPAISDLSSGSEIPFSAKVINFFHKNATGLQHFFNVRTHILSKPHFLLPKYNGFNVKLTIMCALDTLNTFLHNENADKRGAFFTILIFQDAFSSKFYCPFSDHRLYEQTVCVVNTTGGNAVGGVALPTLFFAVGNGMKKTRHFVKPNIGLRLNKVRLRFNEVRCLDLAVQTIEFQTTFSGVARCSFSD